MPESTFLHIQSRGRSPARVVELPGDAVRIGRGLQCEIRLGEPSLAEVECLLRRRGLSWDIQPLGTPGHVTIDGRPVEHLRALVPGVPLRVGDHWLTIRPSGAISPGFEAFDTPIPGDLPINPSAIASTVETDRLGDRPYANPTLTASARPVSGPSEQGRSLGAKIRDNHEFRERWHKTRREQRSWEARWRAAGESLRTRDARPTTTKPVPPPPSYPTSSVATRSTWKQDEATRAPDAESVEDAASDEDFQNEFWEPEPVVESREASQSYRRSRKWPRRRRSRSTRPPSRSCRLQIPRPRRLNPRALPAPRPFRRVDRGPRGDPHRAIRGHRRPNRRCRPSRIWTGRAPA